MKITQLAQIHVIVNDLDVAADFYRTVFGMIEMQSHNNLTNAGLAAYYGYTGNPEDFSVSLRFLFIPDVLTIKLVKLSVASYAPGGGGGVKDSRAEAYRCNKGSGYMGRGPISVVVADLDEAYQSLLAIAQDYSVKFDLLLVSPPAFLSPLQPHEIGATKHSVLHGRGDILDEYAKAWPFRAKFQMIDPFGVQWEFNNNVDEIAD